MLVLQHAHIENIKTVANLTNNKDVFMCILRFHARAGYLQHYETLLKELNEHPASDPVPPDQYEVESASLADRNLNVPCESGIRFPSWTPAELNHILQSHVVNGALSTFGCVDWESDLCRGVMRARCYPFDLPKHRFHGFNPKVLVYTLQRHVHTCNIHVFIISIW